jgi:uncharacterized protein (TIGR00375 family)
MLFEQKGHLEMILDLHTHSRYSRACSKDLTIPLIAKTCEIRGIDIVSAGDFTHPAWFNHLKETLVETAPGIYQLRDNESKTKFILGTEVASIKKDGDRLRRVHHLLFAPSLESVEKFNKKLVELGCNIRSDGRPILGLTSRQILETLLEIDERMFMVPAHAWTPWFGIFGSKGGYDSLNEAFGDLTPYIRAIETGLSSDPLMNWRVPMVDGLTLISNSDAHSAAKLGREANVFAFADNSDITYDEIRRIIQSGDKQKFLYTIEFYPEEGMYHLDGHRDCGFSCAPSETKKYDNLCPRCGKVMTLGVLHRIDALATRTEEEARKGDRVPYKSLVPLIEIIAAVCGVGVHSKRVQSSYHDLIKKFGNEFAILLHVDSARIAQEASPEIAHAIQRVRTGAITIKPGYDGAYGVVTIIPEEQKLTKEQFQIELS